MLPNFTTYASKRRAVAALAVCAPLLAGGAAEASAKTLLAPAKPGTVEAEAGRYILTQAQTPDLATLLVGAGAGVPKLKATIKMPSWARPHLGTDARQHPVVIYPSCASADGGCDLRELDLKSGKDRLVKAASSSSAEEIEGDMDRGALVWLSRADADAPAQIPSSVSDKPGTLRYRAASGATRILPGPAGTQLSLDRGRILLVRRSYQEDRGGEGGAVILDLLRTSGARIRLGLVGSGEDFQRFEGPRFVGSKRVAWAMVSASGSWLRERSTATGAKTRSARIVRGGMSVSPLTSTSVLAVQAQNASWHQWAQWNESGELVGVESPSELVRITGLPVE